MNSQHERRYPVETALQIAQEIIAQYQLRAHDESYGDQLKTYRCQLINDQHKQIFYGFGKGIGIQSKASAYYEAIEHFLIHHHATIIGSDTTQYRYQQTHEATLPSVCYESISNDQSHYQPLYLFDPRYGKSPSSLDPFDYSSHSWKANDTGLASGVHLTDASIHALNELIERDAHSLFLIQSFLKQTGYQPKLINKYSLPTDLAIIVNEIENNYDEDLMIFDMTSNIGIPSFYVSMTKQKMLIQPAGCGTSLNAKYALERALLESLQPLHVQNAALHENQQQIIDVLSNTPLLQRAAIADVTTLLDKAIMIDFHSIRTFTHIIDLEQQLEFLLQAIINQGFHVYRKIIAQHENGFACVKFLVPEFEQFHLVQIGKRILPAKRGMMTL